MIKIWVNEKAIEIKKNFNIPQLLEKVNAPTNGVAVAINNTIISKDYWESQILSENDNILIIQATQGG